MNRYPGETPHSLWAMATGSKLQRPSPCKLHSAASASWTARWSSTHIVDDATALASGMRTAHRTGVAHGVRVAHRTRPEQPSLASEWCSGMAAGAAFAHPPVHEPRRSGPSEQRRTPI